MPTSSSFETLKYHGSTPMDIKHDKPSQVNLFHSILYVLFASFDMSSFIILADLVGPHIHLNICMSTTHVGPYKPNVNSVNVVGLSTIL